MCFFFFCRSRRIDVQTRFLPDHNRTFWKVLHGMKLIAWRMQMSPRQEIMLYWWVLHQRELFNAGINIMLQFIRHHMLRIHSIQSLMMSWKNTSVLLKENELETVNTILHLIPNFDSNYVNSVCRHRHRFLRIRSIQFSSNFWTSQESANEPARPIGIR